MKRKLPVAILVVVLALLAAACGDSAEDTTTTEAAATTTTEAATTTTAAATTTTAAPDATSDGVLKIGYLLPQTGGLSAIIDALLKPIEMGAEEITAAGGSVELVPADSGTDPTIASEAADQLLNDGVDAIIGAAGTTQTLAVIDKVTGSHVPMCSGSNTGASLTTYDDGGYYFRTAPSDVLQGPALAEVMLDAGVSNVAIIYRNEEYGAGFDEVLAAALEDSGVTVAAEVPYDPNATSFDAEAQEVAAAGVDGIAIVTFNEGGPLLQAMIEAGIGPADVPIFVTDGFKDSVQAADVDPDNPAALEGIQGTAPSAAPANGEATFGERLEAFAPGTPTIFSAQKYDCLITMVLASEVAGTDDASVWVNDLAGVTKDGTKCTTYAECHELVMAGEDIDYDGASGPIEFNDAGEPSVGVYDVYEYDAEGAPQTLSQVAIS
jgi:branched-chain amino acid transport system substrate-binding protein